MVPSTMMPIDVRMLNAPTSAVRSSIAKLKRRFNVQTRQELKHRVVMHALFQDAP
jgi:hypothetical protein